MDTVSDIYGFTVSLTMDTVSIFVYILFKYDFIH